MYLVIVETIWHKVKTPIASRFTMSNMSRLIKSCSKSRSTICTGTTAFTSSIRRPVNHTPFLQNKRSISATTPTNFYSTPSNNTSEVEKPSLMNQISSSFQNFKSRHSFQSQSNRVFKAACLFQSIKRQAHNSQWYANTPNEEGNKLKPDFREIHAMLSMHVWFVHRRLFMENQMLSDVDTKKQENLLLQEEIFDLFWIDTQARIRAQDVNELTVNKHIQNAQKMTFVHCTQYDHAFAEYPNDVNKRFEVICDAVWKHVLSGKEDASDDLIRRIGAYVEYQMDNVVFRLPDDYFNDGRVAWGNIPEFSVDNRSSSGSDSETSDDDKLSGPSRGMTFLQNNWVQLLTIAGEPYYWNMDTNETKSERP